MPAPTIFDTKTLITAIKDKNLEVAPQFLLDTFAPNTQNIFGEYVEFDRVPWRNGMAKLVHRGMTASPIQKNTYTRTAFRMPLVKESVKIGAVELFNGYGLTSFDNLQAGDRASQLTKVVGESLSQLKNRARRLEEYLFAKYLTGSWSYTNADNGVHYELNLGLDSAFTPTLAGSNVWTHADSNPAAQIQAYGQAIEENSSQTLTDVVLGSNAANAFLANLKVQKQLWVNNYQTGSVSADQINSHMISNNFAGVRIWTYRAKYQDSNGDQQYYLNPDYALFIGGRTGVRCYGIPDAINGLTSPGWYVNSWDDPDESGRNIQGQIAQLPIVPEIGSWVYAKVV